MQFHAPNGDPVNRELGFELMADNSLARTRISDDVEVSTIFLGIDHNWGSGPPILWETLVFGGPLDQDGERYETRAEALAGHQRWVEQARAAS